METVSIEKAVEMTAECDQVHHDRRRDSDGHWHARLWCDAIGRYVIGSGKSAWAAVQSAHQKKAEGEREGVKPLASSPH